MKRALLILTVAILFPGIVGAQSTVGVNFVSPGSIYYSPVDEEMFTAYVYLHNAEYYITGIEYQLLTPMDPDHSQIMLGEITLPDNASLQIGHPFTGHAIAYWPPLNGFMSAYCLMVSYTFYAPAGCGPEDLQNYPLVIGPHPDSGELQCTYAPDNYSFYPIGMTAIICPVGTSVREGSWGAIKSLYR
jgi:hypothetical protein